MSKEVKKYIVLEESALKGEDADLTNLWFEVDRDKLPAVGNEEVQSAIDAYSRSESNTVGYIAASFAPILILLSTLQYYDELDDTVSNLLVTIVVSLLGFAGTYYSIYKVILLTLPRILLEGFKMKLVNGLMVKIFPSGKWKAINITALLAIVIGYLFLFVLIIYRLWN